MMYNDVLSFHNVIMGDKLTRTFHTLNFSKVKILTDCFNIEKNYVFWLYVFIIFILYTHLRVIAEHYGK